MYIDCTDAEKLMDSMEINYEADVLYKTNAKPYQNAAKRLVSTTITL